MHCNETVITVLLPALARPRKSPNEAEPFSTEESKKVLEESSEDVIVAAKVLEEGSADIFVAAKVMEEGSFSRCNCSHLHKKELLGEKSNRSQIWTGSKFLQSLLVSHLQFGKFD